MLPSCFYSQLISKYFKIFKVNLKEQDFLNKIKVNTYTEAR